MSIPYANEDDLTAWISDALPSNATQLLRSATLLIARAINENPYTVTADQPRKDATTAQAAAWIASGLDPAQVGAATSHLVVKSSTILGGSVTYDTPTVADQNAALAGLAPDAWNILYTAGLLVVPLPVWNVPIDTSTYLTGASPTGMGQGLPTTYPLDIGFGAY